MPQSKTMQKAPRKKTLLWLQSGGCGGCTLSMLCAEQPDCFTSLGDSGIDLLWHPSFSLETGGEVRTLLDDVCSGKISLDILCLEGSVMMGPGGTGKFHMMAGTGKAMSHWLKDLARQAGTVVAIGSCAAFGGITAAGDNHVEATGLGFDGEDSGGLLGADFVARDGLPVINIGGCPTHPAWVLETLMQVGAGTFQTSHLDALGRPRFYADHLVHHGCPRNEFYEYKASAEKLSDMGCMMEHIGCKGTQAHGDCNIRPWNGQGSCLKGGYPCINCTAPHFEEPGHSFTKTPKLAGIPIGLPTDMPKAWFVALASLSKAATPDRLRDNAVADSIKTPPATKKGRKHK